MSDDDKSTYKVEVKYNFEDGVLEIDIPKVFAQLEEDDREMLAQLHAFDSAIWEEIKRCLRRGHASSNYNRYIHKLRLELLSGDDADQILSKTVRGVLFDKDSAERGERFYRDNYWQLRNWCWNNLPQELKREMPPEVERDKPATIKAKDIEEAIAKAQE